MTVTRANLHIVPDDDSVEILSDLALRAAIQADRFLLGKSAKTAPIEELVQELRKSPILPDDEWGRGQLADAGHLSVIGRAMGTYSGNTLRTVSELSEKIRHFVDSFEAPDKIADPKSWRPFLDFCLALHSELMVRRGPIRQERNVED